jgi:hypothetical protein
MLASSASELPKGAGWSYEVKWDGYRTLASKDGERVKRLSRNLKDATKLYPTVAKEVARLKDNSVLLDGEVVAIDEDGRPSFQALHHQAAHTVVYYAFDLLHLDGRDLTKTPLDERRELLTKVLNGSLLLGSEPLPATGLRLRACPERPHRRMLPRELRNRLGLSQEALAERAQLPWTYISGVERGRRSPGLDVMGRWQLLWQQRPPSCFGHF